ncbi:UNVERIFIED_CONTAM: hypothetical protein GTU68_036031 [Idotea baltica]|nr:hypothetical protein [Idotea baltica]
MSNNNEILVKVEGVSKRFCRDLKKSLWYGVKDVASEFLSIKNSGDGLRDGEFWANKDISFELRRGECLGLIGHNGAGKTTLLKMLNGLISPDSGRIEIRGRVSALIALGAGFNPILTGKENVYIAGSVLGLSKEEIDVKYDEIVDFSELHDFMKTPVRNYSSGMQVRLGFAVATAMNPDVLLIDEVLAVGDVGFRTKCYNRINELRKQAAIIFVSHNVGHVGRLCDKSVLLNKGKVDFFGNTVEAIHLYSAQSSQEENVQLNLGVGCSLESVKVNGALFESGMKVAGDEPLTVEISMAFGKVIETLECGVFFLTETIEAIASVNSHYQGEKIQLNRDSASIRVDIPRTGIGTGSKCFGLWIRDSSNGEILMWALPLGAITVVNKSHVPVPILLPGKFTVK